MASFFFDIEAGCGHLLVCSGQCQSRYRALCPALDIGWYVCLVSESCDSDLLPGFILPEARVNVGAAAFGP